MTNSASRVALVTGATGFTGRHLARELKRRGYEVRALVRDPDKARDLEAHGIELIVGELLSAEDVRRAAAGCTHIFHIAAIFRSAKYPDDFYRAVNVGGTRHVLEAVEEQRDHCRVVHCSTVGVHGEIRTIPADEGAPFAPDDIYQKTKLEAEQLARKAFSEGMTGTIVRPTGIYGPGDLRFLKLFRAIHAGRFRMLGSGKVFYHLTYIDDLVDGFIKCAERPEAVGETYILGGTRYVPIRELAEEIGRVLDRPIRRPNIPILPVKVAAVLCEAACRPFRIEPPLYRRRLDFFTKSRAFTSEKARRELGWEPKVELPEGLARTADWYFEQGLLTR